MSRRKEGCERWSLKRSGGLRKYKADRKVN